MILLLGCWKESGPDACREEESCLQRLVHHFLGLLRCHLQQIRSHIQSHTTRNHFLKHLSVIGNIMTREGIACCHAWRRQLLSCLLDRAPHKVNSITVLLQSTEQLHGVVC